MTAQLTIVLSGTQMTWEDMTEFLELGAERRHNLSNLEEQNLDQHLYYMFDGPAAPTSNQHLAVEHLKFDQNEQDFIKATPRKVFNIAGKCYRFVFGSGTRNISDTAFQLIVHHIVDKSVKNIDLIGFSRGGNIALNVGVLLKQLETDSRLSKQQLQDINIRIYAIEPVAAVSKKNLIKYSGEVSQLVRNCVVGLATNESLPGFQPRDILAKSKYNIAFHPNTKYVFLPFPDDHLMCLKWMRDLIKCHIPPDSELQMPCNKDTLIQRKLGMENVKWFEKVDETSAYRMIYESEHTEKYNRDTLPRNAEQIIDLKKGIETFFSYLKTQHSESNVNHTSIQNDADSEKKNRVYLGRPIGGLQRSTKQAQHLFAKASRHAFLSFFGCRDRICKQQLNQYTNVLFVNLLHEALFKKAYPRIHHYLLHREWQTRPDALREFNELAKQTAYPETTFYIQQALDSDVKLTPITALKSTNLPSLDDVYNLCVRDHDKHEHIRHFLATYI